jgi:hypothetical protein
MGVDKGAEDEWRRLEGLYRAVHGTLSALSVAAVLEIYGGGSIGPGTPTGVVTAFWLFALAVPLNVGEVIALSVRHQRGRPRIPEAIYAVTSLVLPFVAFLWLVSAMNGTAGVLLAIGTGLAVMRVVRGLAEIAEPVRAGLDRAAGNPE